MPLAISSGAGSASRHSIGTGVIGGMLAATLLATFLIPMFFMLVEKSSDWLDSKKSPKAEQAHEG
ncbi:Efflux pump membrane transporter BepE [compost metagenome]